MAEFAPSLLGSHFKREFGADSDLDLLIAKSNPFDLKRIGQNYGSDQGGRTI
jgi:hypothetical protein